LSIRQKLSGNCRKVNLFNKRRVERDWWVARVWGVERAQVCLILALLAFLDTILLFFIANKLTDGRCWQVTKSVLKFLALGAAIALVWIGWMIYRKGGSNPLTRTRLCWGSLL
jgi:hypothetical protein